MENEKLNKSLSASELAKSVLELRTKRKDAELTIQKLKMEVDNLDTKLDKLLESVVACV